jgi:hypothetical protein
MARGAVHQGCVVIFHVLTMTIDAEPHMQIVGELSRLHLRQIAVALSALELRHGDVLAMAEVHRLGHVVHFVP